jgi:hypothetical protein
MTPSSVDSEFVVPKPQWRSDLRTRRQLINLIVAVGVVPSALLAFWTWILYADGLLTMNGHKLVVRDYVGYWGAGHLLKVGDLATIYNPLAFVAWLRDVYGPQFEGVVWGYPPSMLFLTLPAGHASLLSGFVLFTTLQMALLWCVGRFAGLSRGVLVAALISPAAIENALGGQNGAMTSALLVGGLLLAGRQSILSGVLLGLLTVKPQLGLVAPFCLLASRDWKALAAAVCTSIGLFVLSGIAFGFESWAMFWNISRPLMTGIMQADYGFLNHRMMVSPFMAARSYGLGLTASYALQFAVTLAAIVAAWRLWRRPTADVNLRMAVTVCLSIIASPYVYIYDTVCIAIAVAILATSTTQVKSSSGALLALAWMWPGLAVWASFMGLQPLGFVVIAALSWLGFRYLHGARRLHSANTWFGSDDETLPIRDGRASSEV